MLGPEDKARLPENYLFKRRKRIRGIKRWVYALVIIGLGVCFIGLGVGDTSLLYLGIGALFLLTWLSRTIFVRYALGRWRGRVCPCCWHQSADPKPRCSGCASPSGAALHRAYWRIVRLDANAAEQWFGDQFRAVGQRAPVTRTLKSMFAIAILVPLATVLFIVIMTMAYNNLSWINAHGSYIWIWLVFIPMGWFTMQFAKRRIGNTRHCSACEYQIAPVGDAPAQCPECGADLSLSQAIAIGRSYGNNWVTLAWVPFMMLFAFGPLFFLGTGLNVSPASLVPTQNFITHIVATDDIDYELEREMESRRLENSHLTDLIDELERRLQNGKRFGPGDDPTFWGMEVADWIVKEANQRSLPHTIKTRLLNLANYWGDDVPYEIRDWVGQEVAAGSFSSTEVLKAESLTPIKRTPTSEFLAHVISVTDIDREVRGELEVRSLDDSHLKLLLDELERRLADGQDLGLGGDPDFWGMNTATILVAEMRRRQPPHDVALRILRLNAQYQHKLPYRLGAWGDDAIENGVFTEEELQGVSMQSDSN